MKNEGKYQSGRLMISCDWGTSSFRLKLVEAERRTIVKEIFSADGMAKLYHQWQQTNQNEEVGKADFYIAYLYRKAQLLIEGWHEMLADIPIVVSGMACSSIGIKEIPYAAAPFHIDGSDAIVQVMKNDYFNVNIHLISGVSSRKDTMRGEETQLIGLSEIMSEMRSADSFTCVFPGTHSKHIFIRGGKVVDFSTFMTGELFDILIHYSILKDAVATNNGDFTLGQADKEAFDEGVKCSERGSLLHSLFSVRVNRLFEYLDENRNYFYLSGLLIGSELKSLFLNMDNNMRIYLCSNDRVYSLYREAISVLGLSERTTFISLETMDKAIVEGHIKLMLGLQKNK